MFNLFSAHLIAMDEEGEGEVEDVELRIEVEKKEDVEQVKTRYFAVAEENTARAGARAEVVGNVENITIYTFTQSTDGTKLIYLKDIGDKIK